MARYNENQLKTKFLDHIKLKLQSAFLTLWDNMAELGREDYGVVISHSPEILDKLINGVSNLANDIENILIRETGERSDFLAQAKELKEDVALAAEELYCYIFLNQTLAEIIENQHKLWLIAAEEKIEINWEAYFRDCLMFVTDEDNKNSQTYMGLLMKCFPLAMTRQKYYEYVKKSLSLLFDGEAESYINGSIQLLKLKFLPRSLEAYGRIFPQIKEGLESFLALNYESLDKPSLEETFDKLGDNHHLLSEISEFLSLLHESVNSLLMIMSFAPSMDYILGDDIIIKDLYYTAKASSCKEDFDAYEENYRQAYEERLSKIVDLINDGEDEGFLDADYDGDLGELARVHRLSDLLYYEMLTDKLYNLTASHGSPANEEFIKAAGEDFIEYIEKVFVGISPKNQRLIRQLFLEALPCPFDKEEFSDYMKHSFENTFNYEKKFLALDLTGKLFDLSGFNDSVDDAGGD